MLRVQGLSKSFGGINAVTDVTFTIESKKITALIGPNGSGKTTVFNCCSGIIQADKGEIWLDDIAFTNLSAFERAKHGLSRTFQLLRVFTHLTVEENLLLALEDHDSSVIESFIYGKRISEAKQKRVSEELAFWGLESIRMIPAGHCSFGQQKLIGLARALLLPHRMVLLDEPVAGVNPRLRQELATLLCALRTRGETLFVIEHDMDFIMPIADHVIVMNEGTIFRQGPPSEIQRDAGVLAIYLGNV